MTNNKLWKRLAVIVLVVVLLFSLLYTYKLVKKVEGNEKENARIWVQTIKQQRKLLADLEMLFKELDDEEQKKLRLWAKAIKRLPSIDNKDRDFSLVFDLVKNNKTIPVLLTDQRRNVLHSRNIEASYGITSLDTVLRLMRKQYRPIAIQLPDGGWNYLYYSQSKIHKDINLVFDELLNSYLHEIEHNVVSVPVLYTDKTKTKILAYGNLDKNEKFENEHLTTQIEALKIAVEPIKIGEEFLFMEETNLLAMIKFYPVIFIILILCFALVLYFYLHSESRYERNFLWVGMSKETAHQLGTPISSLMAWVEVLKEQYKNEVGFQEIEKDVDRLELITDRFSKIGSRPKLDTGDLITEVNYVLSYMKPRISPHVQLSTTSSSTSLLVSYNKQLLGWVFENLIKNAVDAMSGKGELQLNLFKENQKVIIEIEDTGVGIKKSSHKKIFKAGYSTKKRGWGLGLALTKRIIKEYHQGKIFVKASSEGKGTTIRIELGLIKPKG